MRKAGKQIQIAQRRRIDLDFIFFQAADNVERIFMEEIVRSGVTFLEFQKLCFEFDAGLRFQKAVGFPDGAEQVLPGAINRIATERERRRHIIQSAHKSRQPGNKGRQASQSLFPSQQPLSIPGKSASYMIHCFEE